MTRELAVPAAFRASPLQRRLWSLNQAHPAGTYGAWCAVLIEGAPLPEAGMPEAGVPEVAVSEAIGAALRRATERHEILRTTVAEAEGVVGPAQMVRTQGADPLVHVDAREPQAQGAGLTSIDAAYDEFRRSAATRIAETSIDARLVTLDERRHLLMLHTPAFICDGGGLRRLVSELFADVTSGEADASDALQYADVAEWLNAVADDEGADVGRTFWRRQLAAGTRHGTLSLAEGRREAAPDSIDRLDRIERMDRLAPVEACRASEVEAAAARAGVTVEAWLLACWRAALTRCGAAADLLIGVARDSRAREELASTLGPLTRYVPIGARLSPDANITQHAALLRDQLDTATQLAEHFDVEAAAETSPVACGFRLMPRPPNLEADGTRWTVLHEDDWLDHLDVELVCRMADDRLLIGLQFDPSRYDRDAIEALRAAMTAALDDALANPDRAVGELALLMPRDAARVLVQWNDTRVDEAADGCVHRMIAARADERPDAIAVSAGHQHVTYRQLIDRSRQLARHLRDIGIVRGTPVALCLDRSPDLVIGMLAVLEAGGAYVPLDPDLPPQRLGAMIDDCTAPVLLTSQALVSMLPSSSWVQFVSIDAEWPRIAQQPVDAIEGPLDADDLAYIIYTSGSTGRPKGVMVSHGALVNHMRWMLDAFPLDGRDRVFQKTSVGFDASVWEFHAPLMSGACLALAAPGLHRDPTALAAATLREGITVLQVVPSVLRVLLDEPALACARALRLLFCGGEELTRALLERCVERIDATVVNLYGPTETTIEATYWRCGRADVERATVPIGRPIWNTQVYVLDDEGRPVPVGCAGELFIGGAGVARGYLNRSALTAERFVPDPFGAHLGRRLYRTGDRVRYDADGTLRYAGRMDQQIKILGQRVELGEIEAALEAHPAVNRCAVTALETGGHERRLVAHVVPGERQAVVAHRWLTLEASRALDDYASCDLPNGMTVFHHNGNETEFLYKEHFEEQTYLRHGITVADGDCVVDIGANIGMFTMLAARVAAGVRVYAFEPVPATFDLLRLNAALYCPDARVFQCGVSRAAGQAAFSFYPHLSMMSGRFPDAAADRAIVRMYELDRQGADAPSGVGEAIDAVLQERLTSVTFDCPLVPLSDVIAAERIARIDLLKIDAERSELDVLAGIQEQDWPKIQQIVMEVEDRDDALAAIVAWLEEHGFAVTREQEPALRRTALWNVFARRLDVSRASRSRSVSVLDADVAWLAPRGLARTLRADARRRLPEAWVPAAFVLHHTLPQLPNGKIDRAALPMPIDEPRAPAYEAPRTPEEHTIAEIWARVLQRPRIGRHEDFFALGGHSLLATQVMARLRSACGVDLPLRVLFDEPTIASLAARVAAARPDAIETAAPPLAPVSRTSPLPLSFAQQRLWFLDQLDPGRATYNVPHAVRLDGVLDVRAVARSVTQIVARHEVLRTRFQVRDGSPAQVVDPPTPFPVPVVDLQACGARAEAVARALTAADAREPFDLAAGPVLRVRVLRLGPEAHVLAITVHHIAGDGWSMGLLVRELDTLYSAYSADSADVERPEAVLSPLAIQYGDFAVWQRIAVEPKLEAQLAYWRDRLANLPALELPRRSRGQTSSAAPSAGPGAHVPVGLPKEVVQALRASARAHDVTPFMFLLAAFEVLLSRHAAQRDFAIGTAIASRPQVETEPLIGFFVNTLVVRADLGGDPTFAALLARVRQTVLETYANQDVPFERLVEALSPSRDAARTPLFQAMFTLQHAAGDPSLRGLRATGFGVASIPAKFELTLALVEHGDELHGTLEYPRDLFDPSAIGRMSEQFAALVSAAVRDPGRPLSELRWHTPHEDARLRIWSGRTAPLSARSLWAQFEEVARQRPDAIAVQQDCRHVSYGALEARARSLAKALRDRGLGAEHVVGVHLSRSPELIVGVLGILGAGAAYLPLDPGDPPARLAHILHEAKARAVLGRERDPGGIGEQVDWLTLDTLLADYREPDRVSTIEVNEFDEVVARPSDTRLVGTPPSPRKRVSDEVDQAHQAHQAHQADEVDEIDEIDDSDASERLAYVMYTSGSTGRPKGIAVPQRAVTRLVRNTDYVDFGPDQRVLQFAPMAFDASTFEVWGSLLNGGCLVLAPEAPPSLHELGSTIVEQQVTTLWLTAGLFHQMVQEELASLRHVRQLLAGGEVLSREHVQRAVEALPACDLVNGYGPTENTTFTCCHRIPHSRDSEPSAVPIGPPIVNTRVFVVDEDFACAPLGAAGELWVGGAGLARGYVGQPGLTAARFVPDAFSGEAGARLYRTGDRVRWRADGVLEYLGRRDAQVKLRGYRIELGEIEARLAAAPDVAQSAVVLHELGAAGAAGAALIAYVERRAHSSARQHEHAVLAGAEKVPDVRPSAETPPVDEAAWLDAVRTALAKWLPAYMVPTVIVPVTTWPLTPNGKLDRRALPAPPIAPAAPASAGRATAVEEIVAAIWGEVLGVDAMLPDADFFALGGHSLLATRVMARVRAVFGVVLPLRTLFDAPTIADFAARVDAARNAARDTARDAARDTTRDAARDAARDEARAQAIAPPLVARPIDAPQPLSFAQQRLWFLEQLTPGQATYHVPYAVQLTGTVAVRAIAASFTGIVERHHVLRSAIEVTDGVAMQRVQPAAPVPLPLVDLQALGPRAVRLARRLVAAEARRPFVLTRGPLLRVGLLRLAPDTHILTVTLHHLASDGWSIGVLVEEFAARYAAAVAAGEPFTLAPLPVQYGDYAAWQRGGWQETALAPALAYWRQQLADLPALALPTDRPRPAVEQHRGASVPFTWPAALTDRLRAVSRAEHVTLFMTLLAGLQVLLARYSGQRDFAIGTVMADRPRPELEGLIGFFVNTLVLRTPLAGTPTFRELLARVRTVTLDAYAHQDVPFERLVEALMPERDLSRAPLFQVALSHQGSSLSRLKLPDLTLSEFAPGGLVSKFDITFILAEGEESLGGVVEYSTDLFDAPTIARLLAHWETLLTALVHAPDTSVWDVPLVTPLETAVLETLGHGPALAETAALEALGHGLALAEAETAALDTLGHGPTPALPERASPPLVAEWWAARVAATPDRIALTSDEGQLSYAAVAAHVEALAQELTELGVGAEVCVAVALPPSPGLVIALLGILEAGGAYVPIDLDEPVARQTARLAQAAVLVTDAAGAHLAGPGLPVVDLTVTGSAPELPPVHPRSVRPAQDPAQLAYVLYTSGSTGRPKGVLVSHGGLANYLAWSTTTYGLADGGALRLQTPVGFDLTVTSLFGSLYAGQRLEIAAAPTLATVQTALATGGPYALIKLTPSHLQGLAPLPPARYAVRTLVVGGEALSGAAVAAWRTRAPACRVINEYGPTETVVGCCWYDVPQDDAPAGAVPIGQPIAETRVYVVDATGALAPIGVVGELWVGGAGVARGYAQQPALTAACFVPDGFSGVPGARLYRTGDRARWRAVRLAAESPQRGNDAGDRIDGVLEYLGRADGQVKLRGYRVELGEIETALAAHPAVAQSAVVLRDAGTPTAHLVAYVVPQPWAQAPPPGTYRLPDGRAVYHQQPNETAYLYREIVTHDRYRQHGITLPEAACIFDVGANIGLFTLHMATLCPRARIFAFEPVPAVCETLRRNVALHRLPATVFNLGLAAAETTAAFTYYPRFTMMSGLAEYASSEEEVTLVKRWLLNEQESGDADAAALVTQADELLEGRFIGEPCTVVLRRLSDVIREEHVPRIDLLKIDVQRAELEVLRGIDAEHWPLIGQIVMEVHDQDGAPTAGRLREITSLLSARGFDVQVEQDERLLGTDLFDLYAVRPGRSLAPAVSQPLPAFETLTTNALREAARAALPDHMVPGTFVLMDALPLTSNGKLDRRALPEPERVTTVERATSELPPIEEILIGIWQTLLRREGIRRHDDFFALGGHSLLATQVMARVRSTFAIEPPLRTLFEAPTIARLAERITSARLDRDGRPMPVVPPLCRRTEPGPRPLSGAQQRLWFLDQLNPGRAIYNVPYAVTLTGPLNVRMLAHSVSALAARHEVLRTCYPSPGGTPVQMVLPPGPVPMPVIDLGALGSRASAVAHALARRDARQPFTLTTGPVLRTMLMRLAADSHVLTVTLHHIAGDAWAIGLMAREFGVLYAAALSGVPAALPVLALQYGDYAAWQAEWLQGSVLADQRAYWHQQLAHLPALELPTDHARPAVQSHRGSSIDLRWPAALLTALRGLAREEQVTLFMTLLAGLEVLLFRYSSQRDFAVGTVIANRTRTELEALMGFFVNTLVLRADLAGAPTFREVLARVRSTTLDAFAHQDFPFEQLVAELSPTRDLAREPLCQVVLALQNAPKATFELPRLTAAPLVTSPPIAKFDLYFSFAEDGDELAGRIEYASDLFEPATIERLAGGLRQLLEAAVAHPEDPIATLPMLTAAERAQACSVGPTTGLDLETADLLDPIWTSAARVPDAVAVVAGDNHVSYAALQVRAARVAARLRTHHIGCESRVGVCLDRSPDMLATLLGIWSCGAAFVALDPQYPRDRLALMLGDSGVSVLVTTRRHAGVVDFAAERTLFLDDVFAAAESEGTHAPAALDALARQAGSPASLASLIYTSGSTGRPKGVMVTRRNIRAFIDWACREFTPAELSVTLATSSLCFDLSTFELFVPLAVGGRVVLVDSGLAWPDATHHDFTLLNTVPSVLTATLTAAPLPKALRAVNLAGEALPNSLVQRIRERSACCVRNLYGPTETTTYSTGTVMKSGGAPGIAWVGTAIAHTSIFVLDPEGEPAGIGAPGDIWIGGEGVTRGYGNDPALTASRFVPDPFCDEPGRRMYRSGDRGRWRNNGQLEFLGRADDQVKIRGFRVEPGEVEALLRRHPLVRQAAVMAQPSGRGELALAAYLVLEPIATAAAVTGTMSETTSGTTSERAACLQRVRADLAREVPAYMLPATFVALDVLPTTPNGKVDRRALAARGPDVPAAAASPDPNATPTEEIVASVFAEVLGRSRVGVQDDFFASGGHSLLATQVISRLRVAFQIDLPLSALFEAPTCAQLARHVDGLRRDASGPPPLAAVARHGPLPLSFAQQRLWFLDQLQPGSAAYHVPLVLRLSGRLDVRALSRALAAITQRHEVLRTRFVDEDGVVQQRIVPTVRHDVTLIDLRHAGVGRHRLGERLVRRDAMRPFDLTSGRLLRVLLLRTDDEEFTFALTMHHIVSDGWSIGVLVDEIVELYRAFVDGRSPSLPPLPVQYADFACWQRGWLTGDLLHGRLDYWRRQLDGLRSAAIPTDRPRPPVPRRRAAALKFTLGPELTERVHRVSRQEHATPFMTLLAAFQLLLAHYTGQRDVTVGVPIAGRRAAEVERLIGFFVNTLVIRTRIDGEPSFRSLLADVRRTTLQAYDHQDAPFERIVEELAPSRDLSQSALFQVLFSLEYPAAGAADVPGVTLAPSGIGASSTPFDLVVNFWDSDDALTGRLTWDADLFDERTMQRLVRHYTRVLEQATCAPEQPIVCDDMMSDEERALARGTIVPELEASLLL